MVRNTTCQIIVILTSLSLTEIAHTQTPPYPQSTVITGWDID